MQCLSLEQGGLSVEAALPQDISRTATGFQHELGSGPWGLDQRALSAQCPPAVTLTLSFKASSRPSAVCQQPALLVYLWVSRPHRQESMVFQLAPEDSSHWLGHIRTLPECGVRPGHGELSSRDMCTLGRHSLDMPHASVTLKECVGMQRRGA